MKDIIDERNWFAGLAMQALIEKVKIPESGDEIAWLVERSFLLADAMIAQRMTTPCFGSSVEDNT